MALNLQLFYVTTLMSLNSVSRVGKCRAKFVVPILITLENIHHSEPV